jgi:hypothetical protein
MPIVVTNVGSSLDFVLSGGTMSDTIDVGTGHDWIIVEANGGGPFGGCTVGGISLSVLEEHDKSIIWGKLSGTMPTGSVTVTWTQYYHGQTVDTVVISGTSTGGAYVYSSTGGAGASEAFAHTLDTGAKKALAVKCVAKNGAISTPINLTEVSRNLTNGSYWYAQGYEPVEVSGSRTIGWSAGAGLGSWSQVALADYKNPTPAEPPSVGSGYSTVVLGKGPESYWRLHEASGDYVDVVSALDGTHNGTITREVTGNFTWESSLQKNLGIGLGTAAGYVNPGDIYDFTTAASYSIMAWVAPYATQGTGDHYVVQKLDGSAYGYALGVQGSDDSPADALFALRASATGTDRLEALSGVITPYSNQWYCAIVTYDETSDTHRLYMNGTVVAATVGSIVDIPDHASDLTIGSATGASNFNGGVDEVAIWSRALTEREVWELWWLGSAQHRAKEKETYRDLSLTHFPAYHHRLNDPYSASGLELGDLRSERNLDEGVPWNGPGYPSFGYLWAPYPVSKTLNLVPNGTFDSSLGGWTRSDVTSASWQSDGASGGYLEITGDGVGTEDVDNDTFVATGIHHAYEISVDLYSTVADNAVFELVRYDSSFAEVETVQVTGPATPSSWESFLVASSTDSDQTAYIGFRCSVPSASTATSRFRNIVVVPARGQFERGVTGPTPDRYGAGVRMEFGDIPADTYYDPSNVPNIDINHYPYQFYNDFMSGNAPWSVSLWFKVNAVNNPALGTVTPLWTKDWKEE